MVADFFVFELSLYEFIAVWADDVGSLFDGFKLGSDVVDERPSFCEAMTTVAKEFVCAVIADPSLFVGVSDKDDLSDYFVLVDVTNCQFHGLAPFVSSFSCL